MKSSKELQALTADKCFDKDSRERNSKGKKLGWFKAKMKEAARKLRHIRKKNTEPDE
jgi:hypothetical protein